MQGGGWSIFTCCGVNSTSQRLAAVMAQAVVMIVSHRSRQWERQHYRLSFVSHFWENAIIANEKVASSRVGIGFWLQSCWVCQTHTHGGKRTEMFISRAPAWLVGSQQDEKILHHWPSCYCRRKWLWRARTSTLSRTMDLNLPEWFIKTSLHSL